jgi:hypothetical protein
MPGKFDSDEELTPEVKWAQLTDRMQRITRFQSMAGNPKLKPFVRQAALEDLNDLEPTVMELEAAKDFRVRIHHDYNRRRAREKPPRPRVPLPKDLELTARLAQERHA